MRQQTVLEMLSVFGGSLHQQHTKHIFLHTQINKIN